MSRPNSRRRVALAVFTLIAAILACTALLHARITRPSRARCSELSFIDEERASPRALLQPTM